MAENRDLVPRDQLWSDVQVTALRWIRVGALMASVDLELPTLGIALFGCRWFVGKNANSWVQLPQEHWRDRSGQAHFTHQIKMRGWAYQVFQLAAIKALTAYAEQGGITPLVRRKGEKPAGGPL